MSDSGEDRFAKFRARAQKNRAIEEAERRERPKVASSKIMVGGEDVLADEEISVSLWEAVNRLAYEDQVWFSLTKSVDPDTVITRDFCVGRMLDPIGLVGSTFRQIRTAVNRTVGSFRADCGGGDTQEMRCGGYRRADDGTLEKSPLYGKNHVKVSVTEAVVARVLASFCENSTVTSLVNDADKGKSGAKIETHIAKSNSDLNLSTKDGALLALCQNLVVQDPTGKDLFYWKRIEKWIASQELTSTGLDILYWCYRRADLDLSDLPTEEPLPVEEFFKTWTQFPLVRSQMNGLFRQAVWKDGSPVPTHLSLSSMIKLFGPKAIVGRIPSKLASCLTNIILKTDTVSAIESSSGVSVEFVGSSDYSKTDADCFWNPSGIEAAAFKGTLIAVPISTHSQVKLAVDKFARSEKKYALAVTYGSSPTLWCQENVDGYARKQLGVALDLLVASAHWMPFYNLSNAIAGAIDIWGIRMVPTGLDVLRVDTLNCYCYVSMQVKSKIPFYSDDFGAAELVLPTVRDDSLSTRIMRDAAADDAPLVPVARVLGHKRSKVSKPGDDFATQAPEGGFEFFPPTEGPGANRMYG